MDTLTAPAPHDAARLLIDAAEKILDAQHGPGFAAAHPDDVGDLLMTAGMDVQAVQLDALTKSLGIEI